MVSRGKAGEGFGGKAAPGKDAFSTTFPPACFLASMALGRKARKCLVFLVFYGERAGIRTLDLLIKSQLLYRLSYALPQGAAHPRNCGGT
jgi:hypothetical protein